MWVWMWGTVAMGQGVVQRFGMGLSGFPESVVVTGDTLWTAQVGPVGSESGSVGEQLRACLRELERIVRPQGGTLAAVARLHLYGESEEVLAAAREALRLQWPEAEHRPALTQVVSEVAGAGTLTLDAVLAVGVEDAAKRFVSADVGRLPAGRQIYVSGQAESAESVSEATLATLQSLQRTLEFLGRGSADIVQLKAFVQPASGGEDVRRAVQQFFGPDRPQPPLVIVEWKSSVRVPVEIELVAAGGPGIAGQPPIAWVTPPGMTKSPVYSRVCVVQGRSLILTSGVTVASAVGSESAETAAAESTGVLENLQRIVKQAGGDFQHLVKATYYVSTDAASVSLNAVRPRYYDPDRPPAASKAVVTSVGVRGAALAMDLIAVPAASGPPNH
jgi:enamine deaminase RidA (YjgF/YER057c/UK114 family)